MFYISNMGHMSMFSVNLILSNYIICANSIYLSIGFLKFTHRLRHKYLCLWMCSVYTSWELLLPGRLCVCFLSLSSSPAVFFLQDLSIINLQRRGGKRKKKEKEKEK